MSRSKQRSHCVSSCAMCDPGKREPGIAKPSDRRRMQDDAGAGDYSPEEAAANPETCRRECCAGYRALAALPDDDWSGIADTSPLRWDPIVGWIEQ